MAKLKHDNDGFLVGERADLGSETQLLEKISKDIAAIRAALSGNAESITASPQVQQANPVEVSRTESNSSNRESIRENRKIVEVNPRLNQAQKSEHSENRNPPENKGNSSNNRVLLASLETVSNNLHDVHIDLSSMQNSLVSQSTSEIRQVTHGNNTENKSNQTNSVRNVAGNGDSVDIDNSRHDNRNNRDSRQSESVLNSQSNQVSNNEPRQRRKENSPTNDLHGRSVHRSHNHLDTQQSADRISSVQLSENNSIQRPQSNLDREPVAEPARRERDKNGRFIRKDKNESVEPKREVASPKGRDSNGRFASGSSGGSLGSGRGGEEGFISRLADRVGSAVGNTVSGDGVDEKYDPTVAAFKEAAEPIAKIGGAALGVGKTLFSGARSVVNFLPKFENKGTEKTENSASSNQTASNQTANINNELAHNVNVDNTNLRDNVNVSSSTSNDIRNNDLNDNVNVTEISPATREVRQLPARISETVSTNTRERDKKGRFVSSSSNRSSLSNQSETHQRTALTSSRESDNSVFSNNTSNAIEPSRNGNVRASLGEPAPVEPSSRGIFSHSSNSTSPKEKGGKLSLRGAIKEIIASRKEQSIYNKASLKLLKAIAGQETTVTGSGNSGGGFLSGLMGGLIPMVVAGLGALVAGVVGVFTGIGGMLLAGVTGVLGVIFSPIGLAIAAAGALAWGLFTEDGQKFFASIGEYISKGWDATTGFITENFSGVTEAANTFWKWLTDSFSPVTKVAGDLFDGLTKTWKDITDTISGIFDSFSTFLKDKFGIDIPAVVKTVVQPVADAANAAVDSVKETANNVADSAKNTASNLWNGAKDLAGKAVESTKNVVNPAYESVKKSVKDGTVLKDVKDNVNYATDVVSDKASSIKSIVTGKASDNKKAMLSEMANQGITDPKEQAMLMAQVDHESGGFSKTKENTNYSAATLMKVSKTARDKGRPAVDAAVAQGGDAVAELMYGGRMGNNEKGDGAKYKGRGLIQLTGKANYTAASKDLGIDLVNHPELAESPEVAAKTAMWFWKKNNVGNKARQGDVTGVTKTVNGGDNGLADRKQKYAKYLAQANNGELNSKATKGENPADTKIASSKSPSTANLPIETETTLEKLSPISTAAASEIPANTGMVAPEISAQMKGGQDYFLGDSIAHGYRGKGEGDTVVGRNPAKILESMQKNLAENPDFYKGKNVHLSTGMSNNTGDTKSIEAQMHLLKEAGANASVYGVSNNFKGDSKAAAGYNKTLADLSEKYGANFTGGFEASKDTVHPKSYSKDPSLNAAAQKSVEAGLKPEVLAKVNEPVASVEPVKQDNFEQLKAYQAGSGYSTDPKQQKLFEQNKAYQAGNGYSTNQNFVSEIKSEKDIENTSWNDLVTREEAQNVSTYNGQVVQSPQPENFTAENAPAISQYAKTGKMPKQANAKKEAVEPAESPKTETASNSGYVLQDDGEGGKSKIDLETGEVTLATPEEISSYQSGTPAPEIKAQSTSQTPPQKTKEERDKNRLNWAMNTPEGLAAVEAGETLDVNALETKYNRTPDGQTITPTDKLAALNAPEKIAERKKSGAGADEKEHKQGERYKQKEITEPQPVTASSVNTAEKSTIENAKPDSPIVTDIKNRITPQADIAAQLAKNAAPSIPNLASTVLGNAGGGIGEALTGKLPAFLSNPVSAITASVAAPSVPKMPSIPAVSEPPAIKEPLNTNNDSRQQSAVSYPQSEVGQDLSDRRIAHIVSGSYSRG